MNLEQLQNEPKRVKIIDSTYDNLDEAKNMIGGVYEVGYEDHNDKTLSVWSEHKTYACLFNKSDTQIATPLKFNDEYICIADTVNNRFVYDYYWDCDDWVLLTARDNDTLETSFGLQAHNIDSFTPLHLPNKIDLSDDELIQELERRGKLTDGKVIK